MRPSLYGIVASDTSFFHKTPILFALYLHLQIVHSYCAAAVKFLPDTKARQKRMTRLSSIEFDKFKKHLPRVLWLWLPLFIAVALFSIDIFLPSNTAQMLYQENGLIETGQAITIFMAAFYALITLPKILKLSDPFLTFWICIACFGCCYIAGEEINWGQHIFGWQSNDFWMTINAHGETNLHETTSWLDQKPRLIVEMGIIISGLIFPALLKWHPEILPKQYRLIYTNTNYVVCAALFTAFKCADAAFSVHGASPFIKGTELLESFMFYYILIYMFDFYKRICKEATRRSLIHTP